MAHWAPKRYISTAAMFGLFMLLTMSAAPADSAPRHGLTIADVLDTVAFDRVTVSPDGEWIAAVVQRPARAGEVFGRTAYETDPSRSDVWLISRRTGERRNLTLGSPSAAGFWCATWSPNGRKLAMLSTRPEGNEPRGGDNVRLYVWDRDTDALARMGDTAIMTQSRYGSRLYALDLRGGGDNGTVTQTCNSDQENAPFVWLDDHQLLAVMLPKGQVSALIDENGRPFDQAETTRSLLREGALPTVSAVGSGTERIPRDERTQQAQLNIIDTASGAATTIGSVPTYPFSGALSLVISPDRRQIAVLATVGTIQPARGQAIPYNVSEWQVEKRLGFTEIAAGSEVRWVRLPTSARYPVDLLGWSPTSRSVAMRARAEFSEKATSLFVASAETLALERIGAPLTVGSSTAAPSPYTDPIFWIDGERLLVLGQDSAAARLDWWLVGAGIAPKNISGSLPAPPAAFRRTSDGRLVAITGTSLVAFDAAHDVLAAFDAPPVPANSWIAWPHDPHMPTSALLVGSPAQGQQLFHHISLVDNRAPSRIVLPARSEMSEGARLLNVVQDGVLWTDLTPTGTFLRETSLPRGATRDLLALNEHLRAVDWGRRMVIDYRAADGTPLKAGVILPPDYHEGRRYPTITWVYPGNMVRGPGSYFLDAYSPGIYNLQLYAARGYVVLVPSMPFKRNTPKNDLYANLSDGALPAVERLVAMGIADPDRVGVMGQSFGGYSVYSLVTQTNRFKAAVALAGFTDVAQMDLQFDATARGYPGIEHEKSANWSILEVSFGLGVPPYEDPALYWRNSPIAYVDRVQTPLLMIHGEFDYRGAPTQAETFFYSLYRQGKTARLLRYWGDTHSLAQSPANIRNIVDETVRWFDRYLSAPDSSK